MGWEWLFTSIGRSPSSKFSNLFIRSFLQTYRWCAMWNKQPPYSAPSKYFAGFVGGYTTLQYKNQARISRDTQLNRYVIGKEVERDKN